MTRPPQVDAPRPMFQRDESDPKAAEPVAPKKDPPALSAELTAAIAAVTAAEPGSTAAPFITAMQKEAINRELKRRARLRMLRFGALALAALIALPVAGTFIFNREPDEPALAAHADKIAAAALAAYSRTDQPLMTAGAVVKPLGSVGIGHLRYEAAVTLQLRAPLYLPAHTNGTEAFRLLQRSLAEAHDRAEKLHLFRPPAPAPEFPDLPVLLQLAHRTGEPIVVNVPFDARRFGWRWRLDLPEIAGRPLARSLDGLPLERYAGSRTLIFGSPESLLEVRKLVKLARDYVTAVNKEAGARAVAEAPAVDAPVNAPTPIGLPDPNAIALPDPNAPALPDPNAPAQAAAKTPAPFDPNAPAISRPK